VTHDPLAWLIFAGAAGIVAGIWSVVLILLTIGLGFIGEVIRDLEKLRRETEAGDTDALETLEAAVCEFLDAEKAHAHETWVARSEGREGSGASEQRVVDARAQLHLLTEHRPEVA
jgi:hypothetical protein